MAKVQGLDRLRRKLLQMPEAIKQQIRQKMEEAADEIVRMAQNLVPVDSGALRDSIGWTWGDPPAGSLVLAAAKEGDMRITIYAGGYNNRDAFYVRFVEFGTQNMAASPFFYPAYRANKKRAASRIRRAVNKAVKQVAGS